MKSHSLLAVLVGALCVCGLAALWVSVRYYFSAKELQELHGHVLTISRTRNAAQALAQDALAYSGSHPAMVPLLRQFEIPPRAPATDAPTEDPAGETAPGGANEP